MNRTDLIREISKANSVGNPVVDARIADHLIYLGFGTRGDLIEPTNVFELAAAPRKLSEKHDLAMQTSGFEIGVRMSKEFNKFRWLPIEEEK